MEISNNRTSILISSQVPQFVREDHETFVTFLEEYYKFLEQDGELQYVTKNFLNYLDVDNINRDIQMDKYEGDSQAINESTDYHAFLQKLYDNFIRLIPDSVLADRTLILKHAKDFYRARGSEKSVRFLLRILFGKEIDFYYPKRDIIKASDGKWYIEHALKIANIKVNNVSNTLAATNFSSKVITGNVTNTKAIVEFVDTFYDKGQLVTELKISNFDRPFENGEEIFTTYFEEGQEKFISGTLYSGIVASVSLLDGGVGYVLGSQVPVEGGGGSGAEIVISKVTNGSITSLGVGAAGAGFKVNDPILVAGGGPAALGATAKVGFVDLSEKYHPNTYNVVADQIYLEQNTPIGNLIYSNLVPSIVDPANNWIANSMHYWVYGNCGPILFAQLVTEGSGYSEMPSLDIVSNTAVRSMGILGRMEIVDGGLNYSVGDHVEIINPNGSFGAGAMGNVTSVAANGKIQAVKWEAIPGHLPGGAGYDINRLPIANVASATGNGAIINITATIGDGEELLASTSTFGTILELKILSGGAGYTSVPTLNLANMTYGSNGIAVASVVAGEYSYPGRYLNDDGHLSSYNFLEDRDYYQNYSYVIKIDEPINKYRRPLKELTHPAGMKLFGQYQFISDGDITVPVAVTANLSNTKMLLSNYTVNTSDVTKSGSYNVKTLLGSYVPEFTTTSFNVMPSIVTAFDSRNFKIYVRSPRHGYRQYDEVYLEFIANNASANIVNGLYSIVMANTNYYSVDIVNGNTSIITPLPKTSSLTFSTGSGAAVSYMNLSASYTTSNVKFAVGDSLNVSGNIVSVLVANNSQLTVFPPVAGNLSSARFIVINRPYNANGNVTVYNAGITINSRNKSNTSVYLKFQTDDTTYVNGYYRITFANSTAFRVTHRDVANTIVMNGTVDVYSNVITLTANSHDLIEGESVYLTFSSGDMTHATNSSYNIYGVTSNTFNVLQPNTILDSGNVSVKTGNVSVIIDNHGFNSNDYVYMWFTSGDTANISNGYYDVYVEDINTLYINVPKRIGSNGSMVAYRNYMNVSIGRTSHGFNIGDNVRIMLESGGNLANISNGIYRINDVVDSDTYQIFHNNINISSNLNNILPNASGTVYVSKA